MLTIVFPVFVIEGIRRKLPKKDKLLLSKAKATNVPVKPFAIDAGLAVRADAEFQNFLGNADPKALSNMMGQMTLGQLQAIQAKIEDAVLQESMLPNLAPEFAPTLKAVVDAMDNLSAAKTALECSFEVLYAICYYDENSKHGLLNPLSYNEIDFVTEERIAG